MIAPVLALDQSTSATKAIVVDARNQVVARSSRQHGQKYPRPGWVEHDANEIWDNVQAVIRDVLQESPVVPKRLSLTNQRETFVLFNRQGEPVTPALVWQCRRGSDLCHELAADAKAIDLERRTGLFLDTYFSAPKLTWLIQQQPHLRTDLEEGKILFGTIDTYLIFRLTRGSVYATDATNASRTLLFNLQKGTWDDALTELFAVPAKGLPEIRSCSDSFGEATLPGMRPDSLPIIGVMGDSQASLLAQHCISPGDVKATFGTGTSLLMKTAGCLPGPKDGVVNALSWRIEGQDQYAVEGIINFSAATLNWLRDALGLFQSFEEAEKLASTSTDSSGVILIPAFVGLGAPYWAPEARACILGLTPHSNRGHVIRAGYESIGLQIADNLDLLQRITGHRANCLRGDGGPTRSRFLTGLTASLIPCPLEINRHPHLSPIGAVLAGRIGTGETRLQTLSRDFPNNLHRIPPSLNKSKAQGLLNSWRSALTDFVGR